METVKFNMNNKGVELKSEAAMDIMRKAFNGMKADDAVETILNMFAHTKNNREFIQQIRKTRMF